MPNTRDTIGVKCLIDARCPIQDAKNSVVFSALQDKKVILQSYLNLEYFDAIKTPKNITPLFFAALSDAYETATLLLEKGTTVNVGPNDGFSPQQMAAHKGHTDAVHVLLSYTADIEKQSNDGNTPLWCASSNNHTAIVELLLQNKAAVNMPSSRGQTPLFIASAKHHTAVVE